MDTKRNFYKDLSKYTILQVMTFLAVYGATALYMKGDTAKQVEIQKYVDTIKKRSKAEPLKDEITAHELEYYFEKKAMLNCGVLLAYTGVYVGAMWRNRHHAL